MINVEIIAKYDLERNMWKYVPKKEKYGTSLCFANYMEVVNNKYEGTNYIIISDGSLLEDHSRNSKYVNKSALHVNNIINYFKDKKENYSIKLLFLDKDAPLLEDARALAHYIDIVSKRHSTKSITFIGQSKSSLVNFYVPSFYITEESFKKTNIINIGTPYLGTKIYSRDFFYPEIKEVINNKFNDNKLSDAIYNNVIKIYNKYIINTHLNNDIALENSLKENYDKDFIINCFNPKNIDCINRINSFQNFVTGIGERTLYDAVNQMDSLGIALCISNDLFFNGKSDGLVYTEEQYIVDHYVGDSIRLDSTHNNVLGNPKSIKLVLDHVNYTIDNKNHL